MGHKVGHARPDIKDNVRGLIGLRPGPLAVLAFLPVSAQATPKATLARPSELAGVVVEHRKVAPDAGILRIRTDAPAPAFVPGQFLQVRLWERDDPLLGRPFSILDQGSDADGTWLSLLYQVMGRGTRLMASAREGDPLLAVGPLGRPFSPPTRPGVALVVAGGVGIPPFLLLVRQLVADGREVTVLLGARDTPHLYLREELEAAGARVRLSTEDGSLGFHGRVTAILEEELDAVGPEQVGAIYTCGPEGMLEAVVTIAKARGVPGQASLERSMACGYGVCFTCVCRLKRGDGSFHNTRTCLDGPVVDMDRLPDSDW